MGERRDGREKIALLAGRQFGVVSRRQLAALGYDRRRVQRLVSGGMLERSLPGVFRASGSPASWEQELKAVALWSDGAAVVSHRSAARLYGLRGFEEPLLEFSAVGSVFSPRREEIWIHRVKSLPPGQLVLQRTLRLTSPTRTIVDLAGVLEGPALEAALNDVLRRRLTTAQKLGRCIQELGSQGRAGLADLAALLKHRTREDAPTESDLEDEALMVLLDAGLPWPKQQHHINRADGTFVARVDLAYVPEKIAIEVDSTAWHSAPSELAHDADRSNAIHAEGWIVVRATERTLKAPEKFCATVRSLLERRSRAP